MIPLTVLEYELNENLETIFSRLNWAVEEVEYNWLVSMNDWNQNPDTTKNWIGQIDKGNLNFRLEEPQSYFIKRRFNILVKGRIDLRASTTNIKVKLGLENFAFIFIFFTYITTALLIYEVITNNEFNDYLSSILFIIAFPLLGTFLIRRRMKRTERNLDKLFA